MAYSFRWKAKGIGAPKNRRPLGGRVDFRIHGTGRGCKHPGATLWGLIRGTTIGSGGHGQDPKKRIGRAVGCWGLDAGERGEDSS